jgi:hypothetical protein
MAGNDPKNVKRLLFIIYHAQSNFIKIELTTELSYGFSLSGTLIANLSFCINISLKLFYFLVSNNPLTKVSSFKVIPRFRSPPPHVRRRKQPMAELNFIQPRKNT